ncbi:hypothetical protein ACWEGE_15595 [Amycolatopsis sp. NPDC004747]
MLAGRVCVCTFRDRGALAERDREIGRAVRRDTSPGGEIRRVLGHMGRRARAAQRGGQPDRVPHLKERRERLRQVDTLHRAVLTNVELLEEALVDLTTDAVVGRGEVGRLATLRRRQSQFQGCFDIRHSNRCRLDLRVSLRQLSRQPLHLRSQQVLREVIAGIVQLKQLLPLPFDPSLRSLGSFQAASCFGVLAS